MIKERSFRRSTSGLSECDASKLLVVCTLADRSAEFFRLAEWGDARSSEQADEPIVIDAVALAGIRFEAVAIDDRELAVMIANQPGALELSGDIGDPGAPYAKHRGEELVRERHPIRLNAVNRHEQPSGAPLLDRVKSIAGRSLAAKVQDGFGEAQRNPANGVALIKCCLAERGTHAQRCAGNLHNDLLCGGLAAEKSGHSDHTLVSDHPDLNRRSVHPALPLNRGQQWRV
jgi:hypothetical protein